MELDSVIFEEIFQQNKNGYAIFRITDETNTVNVENSLLYKMNDRFAHFCSFTNQRFATIYDLLNFLSEDVNCFFTTISRKTKVNIERELVIKDRTYYYEFEIDKLIDKNVLIVTVIDVTEERNIFNLLENVIENNKFLITALKRSNLGLVVTDPRQENNPIIFASEGFVSITGYEKEEVLGKNCRILQGKETDPKVVTKIRNAIIKRESIQTELVNYRKNGDAFINQVLIEPVFDDWGELTYFIGIQKDVTESKQMEASLMESEQRYNSLFLHNGDAVCLLDLEGRVVEANNACYELIGFQHNALKGKLIFNILDHTEIEKAKDHFTVSILEKKQVLFHAKLNIKPHAVYIEVKVVPIIIDGQTVGLYFIGKDVTLLKEAEKQLKFSSSLFEAVKENVLVLDKHLKVLSINPFMKQNCQLKMNEVIGKSLEQLDFHFDSLQKTKEVWRSIRNKGEWEGENLGSTPYFDLDLKWFHITSIRDQDGHDQLFIVVYRDLSEKEKVHKDVILASKIQRSMLPEIPKSKFFKIRTIYKPSQYISGDFYDFKQIDSKKMAGILVDVMGHGVATALQTSTIRVLFHEIALLELRPADKVKLINEKLQNYMIEDSFFASFYFEYDHCKNVMVIVSAGINYYFTKRNGKVKKHRIASYLLGLFQHIQYEEVSLQLNDGDTVCFVTDGVLDNMEEKHLEVIEMKNDFIAALETLETSNVNDDITVISFEVSDGEGGLTC